MEFVRTNQLLTALGVVALVLLWRYSKTTARRRSPPLDPVLKTKPKPVPAKTSKSVPLLDSSGWPKHKVENVIELMDPVPFVGNAQKGVFAQGKDHGIFVSIEFIEQFNDDEVKTAISAIPVLTEQLNGILSQETEDGPHDSVVAVIGVADHIWRRWDPHPPKELKPFTEKRAKDTGEVVIPATGGDLFLFVKANRIDNAVDLTKSIRRAFCKNLKKFSQTVSFTYKPTKNFRPNAPRDLSGFIDGTRNPDHLLEALVDEVIIFPRDDQQRHVGGSFMYVSKFIHDLDKFDNLPKKRKR